MSSLSAPISSSGFLYLEGAQPLPAQLWPQLSLRASQLVLPLSLRTASASSTSTELARVQSSLLLEPSLSYRVLGPLELGAQIPIYAGVWQTGFSESEAGLGQPAAGLGDPLLMMSAVCELSPALGFRPLAKLHLPAGSTEHFLGEGSATVELGGALRYGNKSLEFGADARVLLRDTREIGKTRFGHQLFLGFGFRAWLSSTVDLGAELVAQPLLPVATDTEPKQGRILPLELAASTRYQSSYGRFAFGVGFGLPVSETGTSQPQLQVARAPMSPVTRLSLEFRPD